MEGEAETRKADDIQAQMAQLRKATEVRWADSKCTPGRERRKGSIVISDQHTQRSVLCVCTFKRTCECGGLRRSKSLMDCCEHVRLLCGV